jgi:hypothetical protein
MKIKNPFKREHKDIMPIKLEEALKRDKLEAIFRPYYLNDQKIDYYFAQEYGSLVQFTRSHGNEIASELGGTIKSNGALALLAGLQADVQGKTSAKLKSDTSETFQIAPIARFNVLRKVWSSQGKIIRLGQVTTGPIPKSHTLVSYFGGY